MFFYMAAWLRQQGYLACREGVSIKKLLMATLWKVNYMLPARTSQILLNLVKTVMLKKYSSLKTAAANYDWDRTTAYPVRIYSNHDGIGLNMRGRQGKSIVEEGDGEKREMLRVPGRKDNQ